jgi:uncharacterized protein YceK
MKRLNLLVFLFIAIFISGCATYIEGKKDGANQSDFSNDLLECRGVAKRLTGDSTDEYTVINCLEGKGWQVKTKTAF